MDKNNNIYSDVDEYIEQFPSDIQNKLKEIRKFIKEIAPNAVEKISYQMPAFFQNGVLVYFAAHKNHIGFYPTNSGIKAFERELKAYKHSKGAIQFLLDKPLPKQLIQRIVQFRLEENLHKEE